MFLLKYIVGLGQPPIVHQESRCMERKERSQKATSLCLPTINTFLKNNSKGSFPLFFHRYRGNIIPTFLSDDLDYEKPVLFIKWSEKRLSKRTTDDGKGPALLFVKYNEKNKKKKEVQNPIHLTTYLFRLMVKQIGGGQVPKFSLRLSEDEKMEYCIQHLRKYFPGIAQCSDLSRLVSKGYTIHNIAAILWMRYKP